MIKKTISLLTKTLPKMAAPGHLPLFSTKKPVKTPPPLESHGKNPQVSGAIGMNQFLGRVYRSAGLSLLGTISTAYAVAWFPYLNIFIEHLTVCGVAAFLIGFFYADRIKPEYFKE